MTFKRSVFISHNCVSCVYSTVKLTVHCRDDSEWLITFPLLPITMHSIPRNKRLKCSKIDFGWSFAPDLAGSLQRYPDPLAGFKGPLKGRVGKKRGREGEESVKERGDGIGEERR